MQIEETEKPTLYNRTAISLQSSVSRHVKGHVIQFNLYCAIAR